MERKKAGVAVLISDKKDFKTRAIIRDKEGHYIMIKGTIQQEDITQVNIYAFNIGAHKYVKQILMDIKGESDRNTVIVGDFNTPLTSLIALSDRKSTGDSDVKGHTRSKRCNCYLQSISSQSSKIYILFK